MSKKVAIIIGTRPEAIKMAPVYLALKQRLGGAVELISTGQHRELLGPALKAFGIEAVADLGVMRPGQSLSSLTAGLLTQLENRFRESKPDLILAHGDTTTCFATAVSSFYHRIPFFHVEAGLRTHHLCSPFPEEFNRQTIAPIADHHFAPTLLERENLLQDGIIDSAITVTGSTVHEAVAAMQTQASPASLNVSTSSQPVVVVTLHRREGHNTLEQTLNGVRAAANERRDTLFVCPVHPNPIVRSAFDSILGNLPNVQLSDALPYPQFIALLLRSQLVITDSGGIQEEAAFLGKSVLLARQETERRDGIDTGLVRLTGTATDRVRDSLLEGLARPAIRVPVPRPVAQASQMIADQVERALR